MSLVKTDVAPTGFPPVAETLPQVIERLVQELKPYKIILFGSYAYGNPTPDSDVDLLVVWDTDLPPRQRVQVVSRLLYPRSFPVDILVKTPEELQQELPHNFFLREIVSRGKVIYNGE
ncbi:MAG: nucleotidyltransferase domain-containing protein [Anaerolineae bacterium]|nr:MAG: nucleotidyltransferase domain-containing protein [Anaerolineae bacterium]